jgi:hypothetical protein
MTAMLDNKQDLWIVLIEADGLQMPSWYYRRRDALAMRVRGERELGPLARRAGEEGTSVIFQEGAIITASESMARTMAAYAEDAFDSMDDEELEGRHPTVSIGRVSLKDGFFRTRKDIQVMNRIENVLGKRGRRPDPETWAVSCTECMQVNEVETWSPVNCPHCAGFMIHARRGEIRPYADPGGDVVEAWKRIRFAGPHWEPTPINADGATPPADVEILSEREAGAADLIEAGDVLDKIKVMPRPVAFDFLDAIFISRAYTNKERRLEERVKTATRFFERGGSPTGVSLTEPKQPDLVDAAVVLGSDEVVTWMMEGGADMA